LLEVVWVVELGFVKVPGTLGVVEVSFVKVPGTLGTIEVSFVKVPGTLGTIEVVIDEMGKGILVGGRGIVKWMSWVWPG
jgi:hypothetical protein